MILEDQADLFAGSQFSTGIIPSGSPVGVEFKLEANGGATVSMEGVGNLTWPEALTLAFTGKPGSGLLLLDGSLAAVTQIDIDLSDYGYEGSFEIDRREIHFDGNKFFDPFVLDGAAEPRVEIVDTTDSTQLIYYDYQIITGLDLKFNADMTPTFVVGFEGVSWTNNEGFTSTENGAMDLAPSAVGDYPVDSTYRGAWDSKFSLVFTPSLQACAAILGCITIAEFDFPIDLVVDQFEQDFPEQTLTFPLPVIEVGVTDADFGEVDPNTQATINVPIVNNGSLQLYGSASIDGTGEFSIFPPDFNAMPGATDGITITFAPTAEGEQSANLVLSSNDPNVPDLIIPMHGNGVFSDKGGPSDTGQVVKEVSTCGCAAAEKGSWATALLALGLMFWRRRR